MWKILVPLAILLLVVFIQLMRVEGFIDPACVRKPGAYSVRCTDGTILDPQGADVPSTCGYKPNITGVVTDPTGGICGSVPPACKGWAYNGSGVWTNFNLVSNTGNPAKKGVGNRGTGGASLYGYSGSYLGNVDVDTSAVSAQLGSTWTGYSGTKPSFSTTTAAKPTTAATTTAAGTAAAGTATGTTAAKPTTTILPPTTTTDASGNTVNTAGTGTINITVTDVVSGVSTALPSKTVTFNDSVKALAVTTTNFTIGKAGSVRCSLMILIQQLRHKWVLYLQEAQEAQEKQQQTQPPAHRQYNKVMTLALRRIIYNTTKNISARTQSPAMPVIFNQLR